MFIVCICHIPTKYETGRTAMAKTGTNDVVWAISRYFFIGEFFFSISSYFFILNESFIVLYTGFYLPNTQRGVW